MPIKPVFMAAALALLPFAAQAQDMPGMAMPGTGMSGMAMAGAPCPAGPAPLPAALAGWAAQDSLTSAVKPGGLDGAALSLGHGASVLLHSTRDVTYVTQPEKPGGSVAHGGLLKVAIADAGTYQISLDSGAWIDVLKDGAALQSTAHAPGPNCSGIRKTVQFALQPGAYVIQISANAALGIKVMVSKVP